MKRIASLHFITHDKENAGLEAQLTAAIAGGVKWVQFRKKHVPDELFLREALKASGICREHAITFVINDRVQIAKAIDSDGVHLGKEDMPPSQARKILGQEKIIGCTANTFEDILSLLREPIDYIGLGPFQYTTTKEKLSPILGLHGYTSMMKNLAAVGARKPIIAIGGIEDTDVLPLLQTGIHGVALSGAILKSKDPSRKTSEILDTISAFKNSLSISL